MERTFDEAGGQPAQVGRRSLETAMPQREVMLALGYYDHRLHLGAARYAQAHDWYLVSDLAYNRRIPWGWSGNGIIAKLTAGDPLARFVARAKVPVVNIGRGINQRFPLVLIDEHEVARLAADHFRTRGFEHHAWVGPAPGRTRLVGSALRRLDRPALYLDELRRAGRDCAVLDWQQARGETADTWAAHQAWLTARMRDLPKPLAVFCWDDAEAAHVVMACRDAGIAIPEQVAVLGVNNDMLACEALPVQLSSIDTDMEGRAATAAALLDRLMAGQAVAPHTLVAPKCVVTRASTDILAIDHEGAARALRYISEHLGKDLAVERVAAAAAMSPRGLHKLFMRLLGRTPIEEILRLKVQRAQDLLRNGDDKVATVARKAGFGCGRNLFRSFRAALGMTPHEYRARYRR